MRLYKTLPDLKTERHLDRMAAGTGEEVDARDFYGRLRDETARRFERSITGPASRAPRAPGREAPSPDPS